MQKIIEKFIGNLKDTFDNEKLKSVILYGSCAVEDCSKTFPNVNVIVVLKDLKANDLKLAGKISKEFEKKGRYLPLFIDFEEWKNSADVYAIEYADIKDRYRILYGENIVEDLKVEHSNLRFQCEQETKNLLIRLRQTYLANSGNKRVTRELILNTTKTFLVIFRTVLRLSNIAVPKVHADVIKLFCKKLNEENFKCHENMFLQILEFKDNRKAIKDSEFEEIIQNLIDSTNYVLKYVDKFKV